MTADDEPEAALLELVMGELRATADERLALRKALLALLLLTGDEAEPQQRALFRSFLLALFPPLADHFRGDCHQLFANVEVMRGAVGEARLDLFVNVDALLPHLHEQVVRRRRLARRRCVNRREVRRD